MSFSIKGYVFEPPRVGTGNSSFTMTPNDVIVDAGTYAVYFPDGSEPNPRVDYMTMVMDDGLLVNATFGWTKNEVVARFDFDGGAQRFRTLPGSVLLVVGQVSSTINVTRLKVPVPQQVSAPVAAAPWRLSVGTGSGTTLTTVLVTSFGAPGVGTVEILKSTGELNWNAADLVTYNGQDIRFQRQAFFGFNESSGKIGISSGVLLLNPLPATGQYPLVRLGFAPWLTPVEKANEGAFSADPLAGTVEWAVTTGRLKFHSADVALGKSVYYDGVLMQGRQQLPRQSVGTVTAPTSFPTQVVGGDLIFMLSGGTQIPYASYVTAFDPFGSAGVVQLLVTGVTTSIQFSFADQFVYGATPVTLVFGDLPIERGFSLRLFRTPVNLTGTPVPPTGSGTKDVTSVYPITGATFINPIIGAPEVFLPQIPRDDGSLAVSIGQGIGTFTPGLLPILDGSVPLPVGPGPTYGYVVDYDNKRLKFAFRKNNVLIPFLQPTGALVLPDPLVQSNALLFSLETGSGTNNFTPLAIGTDILFDGNATVTFTSTTGKLVTSGSGTFTGTNLTGALGSFVGVSPGDSLIVLGQVYTVSTVPSTAHLTTDLPATSPGQIVYEIHHNKETMADRYFAQVELLDPSTRIERILSLGTIANAISVVSGTATFPNTTTLSDLATDFFVAGVQPGDTIRLNSGPDLGSTRTIRTVDQHTLTVQDLFVDFTTETYTVIRRLHVPRQWVNSLRIRFGTQPTSPFSTTVNVVATDSAFTAPGTLLQGVVEVSAKTGNLNFSSADITTGGLVFWARTLKIRRDYTISPVLGFINFTDRFLAYEEALITYATVDPNTNLPVPVVEPAVFLVRKELCQPHPTPVTTLHFNPTGRVIASAPVPAVFRGGRPQDLNIQCVVNTTNSTVTFLPDDILTDALPHGAVITSVENVYVDYYVTQAMGGEQSLTVQLPPMAIAQVQLLQDGTNFVVAGNQTSNFLPGFLLRVEQIEVHLIGSVTYDPVANQTTVNLTAGDAFQDAYNDPKLYESSGPTRTTSFFFFPSYFPSEPTPYTTIPRGMNKVTLTGDRTASYRQGTIIRFTDGASSFQHFYILTAAALDTNGNTVLTLTSNTRQQYTPGLHFLSYSLHPIIEDGATTVLTSKVPILTEPNLVFRRVEGQVGKVLTPKTDYSIDDSGVVTYRPPLVPSEEISIFYTGHVIQPAGLRLQTSYTALAVPTSDNGLLNQQLLADYTIDSPDTFYFRVETMTNFRAEMAQEIQAAVKSSVPSGGPITSNTAGGALFTKGRPSLYFDEGHLANQDIVARASLKWYNDTVNYLEDALQDMDGRVVGAESGRFKFDGSITNPVRTTVPSITNQIDDIIKISDAPYTFTFPPFGLISIGTFQAVYLASNISRFYPTAHAFFGVSAPASQIGDPVLDTGRKNVLAVGDLHTRFAWAVLTKDAKAGDTRIFVDNPNGNAYLVQPPFAPTQCILIQKQDGTLVVPFSIVIGGFLVPPPTQILAVHAGPVPLYVDLTLPLLADAPAGSTIYQAPFDPTLVYYIGGKDYLLDSNGGQVLYVPLFPPLDGTIPGIPPELLVHPIAPGLGISGVSSIVNSLTAPFKFPALYGATTNDDGGVGFPVLSQSFDCEYASVGVVPLQTTIGYLSQETSFETQILADTTAPFVGTGNLTSTTTIQLVVGVFPAPVPKIYDLVRITSGLNAGSAFRRITAVAANSVTVDVGTPFTLDAGFTFEVTVSTSIVPSGTFSTTVAPANQLNDIVTDFLVAGVQVGDTVVIESGLFAGERRQVTTVAAHALVVSPAFGGVMGVVLYRVDNSLATFGGTGSVLDQLNTALTAELTLYQTQVSPTAEQTALSNFFEQVFTNVVTSAAGQTTAGQAYIEDFSVDFTVAGIGGIIPAPGMAVYIRADPAPGTGQNVRGVYSITTVAAHKLTLSGTTLPFANTVAGISYRLVSLFGVGVPGLASVFPSLSALDDFILSTQTFRTLITTQVSVILPGPVADPNTFARATQPSDLTTRSTTVGTRKTNLSSGSGYTATISTVLGGSVRLYDQRYTWIDARINLNTGYITKKQRAIDSRIQAQADVVNQLFKLLSVEGG